MTSIVQRPTAPSANSHPPQWAIVQSRGFSLLEVMIALIVLAAGLLGLAALQNMGLRLGHQSYERTQATLLIAEMIDRMRANPMGVGTGDYLLGVTATPPAAAQDCSVNTCVNSTDMANYDLHQWIATVAGVSTPLSPGTPRPALVSGRGEITPAGPSLFEVSVDWLEQDVRVKQTVRVQLP